MHRLSPLWRIYFFIVATSLATTAAMMYVEWEYVKDTARSDLKYAKNIFTHSLESILHKNEILLDILGNRLIELDSFKKPVKARQLINELLQKSPELAGFGLATPDGQLVVTSFNVDRSRLPNLLKSPKTANSFKQALTSDKMVMGRTYYMKALQQWLIPIRYRIKNNDGKVVAVMTAGLKFDSTKSIWSNDSLPQDMGTIIIRKDLYLQYISNTKISDYKEIYNHQVRKKDFNFLNSSSQNEKSAEHTHKEESPLLVLHRKTTRDIFSVDYNKNYDYYTLVYIPLSALYQKLALPFTWLVFVLIIFNISLYLVIRSSTSSSTKNKRDMQAMLDHSPTVIYIRDIKNKFIFINKKFEQLYKLQKNNVIGKSPKAVLSRNMTTQMTFNDNMVIQGGNTFEYEENIHVDDNLFSYISTKFPLYDNEGNIYALAVISTDITERKQQEELLRNSQKMEAMGKLTGGIAHDYNNMLSVILGYSELLKYSMDKQTEQHSYVDEIEHAARRGAKLTKKLLSFTRSNSLDNEIVDLNTLLLNEKDMLEKTITARIKLSYNLEKNIWPVSIDASDIEDAILNMTINAMHAIKESGQLTIETKNQTIKSFRAKQLGLKDGDYSTITITDTGCGMDKEVQRRIFDPFYSTKGSQGTGLGLSQVYGFMQRSGGIITVTSIVEHGAQFKLYFPRYIGEKNDEVINDVIVDEVLTGNESILLVDDEASILNMTCEILKNNGYNVISAKDGEEAFALIEGNHIDLMISDVVMPSMDGFTLAAKVQQAYPDVKVQLASGYASDYDAEVIDKKLKEKILNKPFSQYSLLKRVRDILDGNPF